MDPTNNTLYLSRVDRVTERLRAVCLGQNTPLSDALPVPLQKESGERRAAFLARQLLFALALACEDDLPSEMYARSREWLYEGILYLLRDCREEDRNFYELGEILRLPQGVRALLLPESQPSAADFSALRKEETMPWPLENFDLAVLMLLAALQRNQGMKPFFQKAETLLSEAQFEL